MASSHSSMSTSPSLDVSNTSSAFSRRAGWSKNWRLSSPQVRRKLTTSLSSATALTISVFVSVPRVVFVDHLEALARRIQELGREFFDLLARRLGLPLALGRAGLQLVRQRSLDRRLPLGRVDLAIAVRVQRVQGGLEARGHQQVLQSFGCRS